MTTDLILRFTRGLEVRYLFKLADPYVGHFRTTGSVKHALPLTKLDADRFMSNWILNYKSTTWNVDFLPTTEAD